MRNSCSHQVRDAGRMQPNSTTSTEEAQRPLKTRRKLARHKSCASAWLRATVLMGSRMTHDHHCPTRHFCGVIDGAQQTSAASSEAILRKKKKKEKWHAAPRLVPNPVLFFFFFFLVTM
ncbi:unnamed protein product [Ectocarpus sp. 12 AP-2014]